MTLEAIDPTSGETVRTYDEMSDAEVDEAIGHAHAAFLDWRRTSMAHRAERMRRAAAILRERARELGELMSREMGKLVADGVSEAEKCAWVCEYYADHAEDQLARQVVETPASKSFVTFQPIGVVLAVMPWNFPFWQVFRFAAPNLMAGNAGVLKHASNVPGCALAIEQILRDAGFPEHLFRTLLVPSRRMERIIADERIRAVTLTGSVRAGKAVAGKAGSLCKKTVLELGGSDAYVVLEDADLDAAVETCVKSRLINSGQSCIAAKRFIVVDPVYDAFRDRFVERMRAVVMGDPADDATELGPQARADLRDELHEQVQQSVAAGARCVLGGEIPARDGAWYPATVLEDVRPGMPAYDDELFGPVAALIRARDEADAIRIANDSRFGLGAAVFTGDRARGERIAAEQLDAGACFVNAFVRSDPRLPFGGVKESGYGRELSGFGIHEFVNIKTVWVD